MEESVISALKLHAEQCYPQESCGVIIVKNGKRVYRPCRNTAGNPYSTFQIAPEDYAEAEDAGEITHIVHSHPNTPATPSLTDVASCESSGLVWLIVNWPNGDIHELKPTGYEVPLLGREYSHGVLDCFSLVRDYYKRVLGIDAPDFPREEYWWKKGQNLYLEHFAEYDMFEVKDGTIQEHDVLLMQLESPVPNHAAVYIGGNLIVHHCFRRLSSRDVYGGMWQKITVKVIRHRSKQNA